MTLLAFDLPPWEYVLLFAAIVLGAINKAVEFSKKVRQKSIEAERKADAPFGSELDEAPEPEALPPQRLELVRRVPPQHREETVRAPEPPTPLPARPVAAPKPRREHEIVRMLRSPQGARQGVILAEVLGPPKARRR